MIALKRGAVVAVVAVLGLFIGAAPAYAYVNYTSNGCVLSMGITSPQAIGTIRAASGTCDGDNVYRATVYDDIATSDGYCVVAKLQGITMATSCNSSGTSFTFTDPDGNSNASIQVCCSGTSTCAGPAGGNKNF
ncbi:hypothetical protein [Micromonospora sp. NPDC005172]|uniref:hypothetical protein n=1 Tax=Micromonospora sp. NPDC005172 TaxID=3156867 RepID=UPI0033BD9DE8